MCSAELVKLVTELVNLVKELVKVQKVGWICILQLSEPAPRVTPAPPPPLLHILISVLSLLGRLQSIPSWRNTDKQKLNKNHTVVLR